MARSCNHSSIHPNYVVAFPFTRLGIPRLILHAALHGAKAGVERVQQPRVAYGHHALHLQASGSFLVALLSLTNRPISLKMVSSVRRESARHG